MRTSSHGVEFIAAYEGFVDHPYVDSSDVWTIGYGHTGSGVASMGRISHAQGLELLAGDVRGAERAVNALGLRLTQSQFDALVSFVFNCGPGTLAPTRSLGQALRQPGMKGVPAAMELYTRDGHGRVLRGLVKRRAAEGAMFRKGDDGPAGWLSKAELKRCRELDRLRKRTRRTRADERRIGELVRRLTAQRKLIWHRAQPKPEGDGRGWDYGYRRQRYRSLLARTA
jgi:GH24 family phage-related lysozyme (muramidase)